MDVFLVLLGIGLLYGGGEALVRGAVQLARAVGMNHVALEVGDTGRGIPADQQEKVFDFAYTTRDGGSGLGLAMVHQCVVADHHGRVALRSAPGEGTRVRLSFPAGTAAVAPPKFHSELSVLSDGASAQLARVWSISESGKSAR